uniref:Uncharacterized protein n=1 Tax=Myoviridae sp. ctMYT7 TaxID=2825087 RepID=A0A8S5Q2C7_9CAUD|nr:MAG TPA: hypothetical protein [Myoviridae sp. ctMYT7]
MAVTGTKTTIFAMAKEVHYIYVCTSFFVNECENILFM